MRSAENIINQTRTTNSNSDDNLGSTDSRSSGMNAHERSANVGVTLVGCTVQIDTG